mgnify:CR=1 FL=1
MIPTPPFRLCCMAFNIETKSDEFDKRCLTCSPRADNNVQTRHELNIKAIQKTFFNLNTFNMHVSRSPCLPCVGLVPSNAASSVPFTEERGQRLDGASAEDQCERRSIWRGWRARHGSLSRRPPYWAGRRNRRRGVHRRKAHRSKANSIVLYRSLRANRPRSRTIGVIGTWVERPSL